MRLREVAQSTLYRAIMMDKTVFLADFEKYFAEVLSGETSTLNDVARYCALDGGKRVRPLCVYLGAVAAGGNCPQKQLSALAAGVELVHSYSLVHDDLPAMDNDSMRRGKPSAHVAFGEANAILGGDFLLSLAFEHLANGASEFGAQFARAAHEIALAALDMAHGQAVELNSDLSAKDKYLEMCAKKTGALILGALRAGAIVAGADDLTLEQVSAYGRAIGLIFQISDDLLDGDGIVALVGEEEARLELELRLLQAVNAVRNSDPQLIEFAQKLANRRK